MCWVLRQQQSSSESEFNLRRTKNYTHVKLFVFLFSCETILCQMNLVMQIMYTLLSHAWLHITISFIMFDYVYKPFFISLCQSEHKKKSIRKTSCLLFSEKCSRPHSMHTFDDFAFTLFCSQQLKALYAPFKTLWTLLSHICYALNFFSFLKSYK